MPEENQIKFHRPILALKIVLRNSIDLVDNIK